MWCDRLSTGSASEYDAPLGNGHIRMHNVLVPAKGVLKAPFSYASTAASLSAVRSRSCHSAPPDMVCMCPMHVICCCSMTQTWLHRQQRQQQVAVLCAMWGEWTWLLALPVSVCATTQPAIRLHS